MKKLILAVTALMVGATTMAQENDNKRPQRPSKNNTEMVKQRTDRMIKRYELNETQAAALLKLNQEFDGKMTPRMKGQKAGGKQGGHERMKPRGERPDSLKGTKANGRDSRHENMQKTRADYNEKLKTILTDKQFAAYQADMQRAHRGPREKKGNE